MLSWILSRASKTLCSDEIEKFRFRRWKLLFDTHFFHWTAILIFQIIKILRKASSHCCGKRKMKFLGIFLREVFKRRSFCLYRRRSGRRLASNSNNTQQSGPKCYRGVQLDSVEMCADILCILRWKCWLFYKYFR